VDWMHLSRDRGQWRAVVNTVLNLRAPIKVGNSLTVLSDCVLLKKDSATCS
jgi:hypothetical protein